MSINIIMNVLLGTFLTWTLLSLGAMQIQEWTATRLKWRSRMLEKSLGKMLTDVTLLDQFYNHPLIRSLFTGKNNNYKPSYIPASEFSQAMIDLLASNGTEASLLQHELFILYSTAQKLPRHKRTAASERISLLLGITRKALVNESGEEACREILDTVKNDLLTLGKDFPRLQSSIDSLFETVRVQKEQINDALIQLSFEGESSEDATMNKLKAGIAALSITHPQLKQTLSSILNSVPQTIWQKVNELELVRTNLEDWFNNAMDRLSGWYKRRTLGMTLLVGVLLAVIFNVDSLNLVNRMWQEPDLRLAIVEKAEAILTKDSTALEEDQTLVLDQNITDVNLPIGWLGSPIAVEGISSAEPESICTLTPVDETKVYGVFISGQCYPIINAPRLPDTTGWLIKLAGILISGAAASPGSSFWFDLLKKIINIRFTGAKPVEIKVPSAG
jgi:hypothetical protein